MKINRYNNFTTKDPNVAAYDWEDIIEYDLIDASKSHIIQFDNIQDYEILSIEIIDFTNYYKGSSSSNSISIDTLPKHSSAETSKWKYRYTNSGSNTDNWSGTTNEKAQLTRGMVAGPDRDNAQNLKVMFYNRQLNKDLQIKPPYSHTIWGTVESPYGTAMYGIFQLNNSQILDKDITGIEISCSSNYPFNSGKIRVKGVKRSE
jgi:hypothetical protein